MGAAQDAEVTKLGIALSKPAFRKAFAKKSDAALQAEGIVKKNIPSEVLSALTKLSESELGVLAKVKDPLQKKKISDHASAQMV